jgi:hypothetical protein
MAVNSTATQSVWADFPNRLTDADPLRDAVRPRIVLVLCMAIVGMIPRTLLALKLDSICPDGTLYLRLAQALDRGDWVIGLSHMCLNPYPLLLVAAHRLGVEWEYTGKVVGVLSAGLVPFPLFGWVRRQFDDRAAMAACFLYNVHTCFVRWSPETLRDPTFWLLFTSTLYVLWRAVTEVRLRWFAAAGLTLAGAAMTRFEGWYLLLPLTLWSGWRFQALQSPAWRRRLLAGVAICVSIAPMIALLATLTVLRGHPFWDAMRWRPLTFVQVYFGLHAPDADDPVAAISFGQMLWKFGPTVFRGLTPLFGLLLLVGVWRGRRTWFRSDHQPLFFTALAVLTGMWIHLWVAGGTCSRYVLPVVIMGDGFAAVAFLSMVDWLTRQFPSRFRWLVLGSTIAVVAVLGTSFAVGGDYSRRGGEARLGRWIGNQFGPTPVVLGPSGVTQVIGYYAGATVHGLPPGKEASVVDRLREVRPDVLLLLSTRHEDYRHRPELNAGIEAAGYRLMGRPPLPDGLNDLSVYVRTDAGFQARRNLPEHGV